MTPSAAQITADKIREYLDECAGTEKWPSLEQVREIFRNNFAPIVCWRSTRAWIVGKTLDWNTCSWEFQGVFEDEDAAVQACIDERFFVGPAHLNLRVPFDRTEWVGAYYPHLRLVKDDPPA